MKGKHLHYITPDNENPFEGLPGIGRIRKALELGNLTEESVEFLLEAYRSALDRIREENEGKLAYAEKAFTDELTGLPNKRKIPYSFGESKAVLKGLYRANDRTPPYVSIMYSDLDGFKGINDREGHDAGDNLIVAFGDSLVHSGRETDIHHRIGGDEFLSMLPGADEGGLLGMIGRASDLYGHWSEKIVGKRLTFSYGISEVGLEEMVTRDAEELLSHHIKEAERAMADNKNVKGASR